MVSKNWGKDSLIFDEKVLFAKKRFSLFFYKKINYLNKKSIFALILK